MSGTQESQSRRAGRRHRDNLNFSAHQYLKQRSSLDNFQSESGSGKPEHRATRLAEDTQSADDSNSAQLKKRKKVQDITASVALVFMFFVASNWLIAKDYEFRIARN